MDTIFYEEKVNEVVVRSEMRTGWIYQGCSRVREGSRMNCIEFSCKPLLALVMVSWLSL